MCSKAKGGWIQIKKYTSRLDMCVARPRGVDLKDEVHIET